MRCDVARRGPDRGRSGAGMLVEPATHGQPAGVVLCRQLEIHGPEGSGRPFRGTNPVPGCGRQSGSTDAKAEENGGRPDAAQADWFRTQRYGMFIHFNIATVPAFAPVQEYADWYWAFWADPPLPDIALHPEVPFPEVLAWHREHFPEVKEFDDFIPYLTMEKFDADAVDRARRPMPACATSCPSRSTTTATAGGTPPSPNRTSMQTGPKRDVIAELAEATRQRDLTFGRVPLDPRLVARRVPRRRAVRAGLPPPAGARAGRAIPTGHALGRRALGPGRPPLAGPSADGRVPHAPRRRRCRPDGQRPLGSGRARLRHLRVRHARRAAGRPVGAVPGHLALVLLQPGRGGRRSPHAPRDRRPADRGRGEGRQLPAQHRPERPTAPCRTSKPKRCEPPARGSTPTPTSSTAASGSTSGATPGFATPSHRRTTTEHATRQRVDLDNEPTLSARSPLAAPLPGARRHGAARMAPGRTRTASVAAIPTRPSRWRPSTTSTSRPSRRSPTHGHERARPGADHDRRRVLRHDRRRRWPHADPGRRRAPRSGTVRDEEQFPLPSPMPG